MNKAILYGNAAEPEMRKTRSGLSVLTFSLATNKRWKDDKGEKQERADWHNIVIYGVHAENAHRFIQKGTSVLIEGELRTRTWEGKDGKKNYRTEVIASHFTAGERRKNSQNSQTQSEKDFENMGTGNADDPLQPDDLPF